MPTVTAPRNCYSLGALAKLYSLGMAAVRRCVDDLEAQGHLIERVGRYRTLRADQMDLFRERLRARGYLNDRAKAKE